MTSVGENKVGDSGMAAIISAVQENDLTLSLDIRI